MRPSIGVLMLEAPYLEVEGALRRPDTWRASPRYRTVPGATGARVAGPGYREATDAYVREADELVSQGATLVTANCGFAVAYQDRVAAAVPVPVVLSSLLLVPLLARVYGAGLGLLTYDVAQLDAARRAAASWPTVEIPLADVAGLASWQALANPGAELDVDRMRTELLGVVDAFMARHRPAALLLECTGFSPFIDDIRTHAGVPVYDVVGLVHFVLDGRGPLGQAPGEGAQDA